MAYYFDAGAGGNSYKKDGDTSSDSSSDSDSDSDEKYSGSKGGRGYAPKGYNGVRGEGNSHDKPYKSSGGASYKKASDSGSNSDSVNGDNDSQSKAYQSSKKYVY
ncbi:hypothetical protein DSO57_1037530 [Entomophthora muscae]|nr:hypothetical protein DSO57_1037530 [Entomophthora muscae]